MSKQDRQGARTPAELDQRYRFGETFAKIMGLAEDAQNVAMKAAADGEVLKTEVIRTNERVELNATAIKKAQDSADNANTRVTTAETGIALNSEQIELRAKRTEVDEVRQLTVSQYTTINQRADAVDISVTDLRKEVGSKAEKAQVDEVTEHFRFAEDGLTISNTGTGMGINVSEKQVAFIGGSNTVITPNEMETNNMRVGTRLDVGRFALIPRTNGNLSLRYTGG